MKLDAMTTLPSETMLAQGTDHVETAIGDQVMMMHIENGKYYALEGTARRIWELLEEPRTLDDVVAELVGEYEIDSRACRADVSVFVRDLMENGLVVEHADEGGT